MTITAVITEYNPFHNGHLYHIQKARELTSADYIIAIMSGNYVQRGAPALISKYERTNMALACGVDAVFELPVLYATASAEIFATGAVSLMDQLGCVDYLCFGSEEGSLENLKLCAKILLKEPSPWKAHLQEGLKNGKTFAKARNDAFSQCGYPIHEELLNNPNNILGIEYMKALISRNSSIKPVTIKRIVTGYHDTSLAHTISSATAIRTALQKNDNLAQLKAAMPSPCYETLLSCMNQNVTVDTNDLSAFLNYRLLRQSNFTDFFDQSSELSGRLANLATNFHSYEELIDLMKTKQYTRTRISRFLLHFLLDIKTEEFLYFKSHNWIPYARLLGFRNEASPLLSIIKKQSSIPLLTKTADYKKQLTPIGYDLFQKEVSASHLYNLAVYQKSGIHLPNEYKAGICKYSKKK